MHLVKLEKFEGPLSLLLKLIEKEEMDVTQISLAGIADQYVGYIRTRGNIKPEEMADFLLVAAKLLLIKSKALLPYLFPEEEEEIEEFEAQLKMYKEFLEASKRIQKMLGAKKFMFAREFNRKVMLASTKAFSPPRKLTKADMRDCFAELLTRIRPPEEMEEETLDVKINIDDKIDEIKQTLLNRIKISFKNIMERAESKTEVIVCFLAMLELVKTREVVVEQDELFSEILIEKLEKSI